MIKQFPMLDEPREGGKNGESFKALFVLAMKTARSTHFWPIADDVKGLEKMDFRIQREEEKGKSLFQAPLLS